MARRLAALKRRAAAADLPVIYVNDNVGQWRSDVRQTVRPATRPAGCHRCRARRHAHLAIMPTDAGKSLCYCLYHSDRQRRPYRLEIHHRLWSLQSAHATITRNTMAAATHLTINGSPTLLHFARRQDVVASAPTHLSDHHHRSVRNVTE